jgi:hypothetical protein
MMTRLIDRGVKRKRRNHNRYSHFDKIESDKKNRIRE